MASLLMILVDFHVHIGKSQDGGFFPLTSLLKGMKTYGIRHAAVFPIDEVKRGRSYDLLNDKIIRLTKKHRQFIGFMRLDPTQRTAALKELHRCFHAGLSGVKLHPRSENFSPCEAEFLFPVIARFGLPVILHTSHERNCTPQEWHFLFKKYPSIRFILAHGGKDLFQEAARIVRKEPNLFIETSTLSYFRTQTVLRMAGAGKVLFASDLPYSHPGVELSKLRLSASQREQYLIFEENPKKIFPRLAS